MAAEFKLSRFKYNWKGAWAAGTVYNPDDVVSVSGKVYTCIERHTANANFYVDLNNENDEIPPKADPRWELMSDGVSWKGAWQTGTYYNVGDIVKFDGQDYICIVPHTSASTRDGFAEDAVDTDDAGPDTPYWETYLESVYWANDWQPETFYGRGTVVKNSGKLYIAIQDHVSTGDTSGLITDATATQAKWDEYFVGSTWRGDWQTDTVYYEHDLVRYGGIIYRALDQARSAVEVNDGLEDIQDSWEVVFEGIEYKGSWAQDNRYKVNDVVKLNGYLYKCNTPHYVIPDEGGNPGDTFTIAYWDIYCPGQEFKTEWSDTVVYNAGDIVINGGWIYVSNSTNLNSRPDFDLENKNPDWDLLFTGTRVKGEYANDESYFTGDLVTRNGQLYVAKQNVPTGQDTDMYDDGSSLNIAYWDLYMPGSKWLGGWIIDAEYVIGDLLLWRGATYRCVKKHVSNYDNRPDQDENGIYWEQYTYGDPNNVLSFSGDIKTYGIKEDGSSIGTTNLLIGEQGQSLQVVNGSPAWVNLNESEKVYFVSENGVDARARGTTQNAPWKTVNYALQQITGPATLFVKTGVYKEILPMVVPADVAVVGDELRGTIIKPQDGNVYTVEEIEDNYSTLLDLFGNIMELVIQGQELGNSSPSSFKYTTVPQDFTAIAATKIEALVIRQLLGDIISYATTDSGTSISGSNTVTTDANVLNAIAQLENNTELLIRETIAAGERAIVDWTYDEDLVVSDLELMLKAVTYDLTYDGNYKSVLLGKRWYNGQDGTRNLVSNMFLVRNGTGIRNMTLSGLTGELGDLNLNLTRRPTAGAYVSLDTGYSSLDQFAWITSKSPYVQNVTTFGTACIGLKIDGDLHTGGNKSIVANDFTQILSDGIGIWCNSDGLTELVSVFTYYNHIGYLCTAGGKIRGTNGNCSYGQYGAVAEGFNNSETPISGKVNNRYYDARVADAFVSGEEGEITRLFYSHSGENYTNATYSITGAGTGAQFLQDEFRDSAISNIRLLDPGDSSNPGGSGYTLSINTGQGGGEHTIIIAGSEEATLEDYQGLRIVIQTGTGKGQYGYIADYYDVTNTVWVAKESYDTREATATAATTDLITLDDVTDLFVGDAVVFTGTGFGGIAIRTIYYVIAVDSINDTIKISATSGGSAVTLTDDTGSLTVHHAGWEHFGGREIDYPLDTTTAYYVEPRVTFTAPPTTIQNDSITQSATWKDITYGNSVWIALEDGSGGGSARLARSENGINWSAVTFPDGIGIWTAVTYGDDKFIAVGADGIISYSDSSGNTWTTASSIPNLKYTGVSYGNGVYIAVADGTDKAARSTDGDTWTQITLSGGADWSDVTYGKGVWVAVSQSDSSLTETSYSTDDGQTWTAGSFVGGCKSVAYGNNRFVAIAGGYAGANSSFVSFDGITWTSGLLPGANWQKVAYGEGSFMAVAQNEGYAVRSADGRNWHQVTLPASDSYSSITYGKVGSIGKFVLLIDGSNEVTRVITGTRAQGRLNLAASRINEVRLWEQGSGYTGDTPTMDIFDPNNSSDVIYEVNIASGVLGNPSIVDAGSGYTTLSTRVTLTGDGYAEEFQTGKYLVVDGVTRLPSPGDNFYVDGIDDYTYKVLNVDILIDSPGDYTLKIGIAKDMGVVESPVHGNDFIIRQQYSQVRLTGHDFLDIGLGNFYQTNYPTTLFPIGTVLAPEDEIRQYGGGRVFYTATDQDGNYRVGELFAVEQSSGTVTISADFFELEGLEEISLGGVTVGGSGVVIREFSTDPLFVADSNNIVPTQRAIKEYIARRVSGGGSDAFTGRITAGVVSIGPRDVFTTTEETIQVPVQMRFNKPIKGSPLVQMFFLGGEIGMEDDYND